MKDNRTKSILEKIVNLRQKSLLKAPKHVRNPCYQIAKFIAIYPSAETNIQ